MKIKIVKTRIFLPPRDDLKSLIKESIKTLKENSIVCITSKIVSIGEGRCILQEKGISKERLAIKEADYYLPKSLSPFNKLHTIKNGILVGSSGIDESNSNGYFILWPKNPDKSAFNIWKFLKKEFGVENVGVIICDSYVVALKRGIVGRGIAYCGFEPLRDYRGKKDLFSRKFKFSQLNVVDSVAAFAVFLMGEGSEQTPIVIFENLPYVVFRKRKIRTKRKYSSWKVPIEEDLFKVFLTSVSWKRGEGKKL